MEIPQSVLDEINNLLDNSLAETVNGELLKHPDLELLKVMFRNGALEIFKSLSNHDMIKE